MRCNKRKSNSSRINNMELLALWRLIYPGILLQQHIQAAQRKSDLGVWAIRRSLVPEHMRITEPVQFQQPVQENTLSGLWQLMKFQRKWNMAGKVLFKLQKQSC